MWLYNFPTDPVSKPTSKSMRTALSRPSAGRLPGPPPDYTGDAAWRLRVPVDRFSPISWR